MSRRKNPSPPLNLSHPLTLNRSRSPLPKPTRVSSLLKPTNLNRIQMMTTPSPLRNAHLARDENVDPKPTEEKRSKFTDPRARRSRRIWLHQVRKKPSRDLHVDHAVRTNATPMRRQKKRSCKMIKRSHADSVVRVSTVTMLLRSSKRRNLTKRIRSQDKTDSVLDLR